MDEPGLEARGFLAPLHALAHTASVHSGSRENLGGWVFELGFSLFKDNEEIQCVLCTWIVDWDLYPLHWLGLVMILFINMFFGCFTYVLFSKVDYVSDGEEYFKRSVIILHCALNITLCTQWVISKYWCTVQSLQNGARHRGTISLHQITFLSQYNIFVFATTEYCHSEFCEMSCRVNRFYDTV